MALFITTQFNPVFVVWKVGERRACAYSSHKLCIIWCVFVVVFINLFVVLVDPFACSRAAIVARTEDRKQSVLADCLPACPKWIVISYDEYIMGSKRCPLKLNHVWHIDCFIIVKRPNQTISDKCHNHLYVDFAKAQQAHTFFEQIYSRLQRILSLSPKLI